MEFEIEKETVKKRSGQTAADTAAASIGDAAAGTDTTTAAQTVAIAAAEEAAAIATNLEGEISRLQLLLIAERAATAAATDAAEANTESLCRETSSR